MNKLMDRKPQLSLFSTTFVAVIFMMPPHPCVPAPNWFQVWFRIFPRTMAPAELTPDMASLLLKYCAVIPARVSMAISATPGPYE